MGSRARSAVVRVGSKLASSCLALAASRAVGVAEDAAIIQVSEWEETKGGREASNNAIRPAQGIGRTGAG